MAFLRSAISGQLRRGFVRLNGALWYGAARPAGEGAGVLVLAPLDEAWAKALATGAGVDVTLSVPEVKPLSTAKPTDLPAAADRDEARRRRRRGEARATWTSRSGRCGSRSSRSRSRAGRPCARARSRSRA